MKFSQILSQIKIKVKSKTSFGDLEFRDIAIDSRLVKKGTVFFALAGKSQNGSKFIDDAIKNGAVAVVCDVDCDLSVPLILCDEPFALLVEFLQIFYSSLPGNIYAVTGTNGKTSVAEFTRQILNFLGKNAASMGTLGVLSNVDCSMDLQNSSLTTPDIVSFYKNLSVLKKNNIDDVAIEASSIGLEQGRIAGVKIDVASFTNFTQDHLDYHQNMEKYFDAKMILFAQSLDSKGCAVLNSDILEFEKIKKICKDRKIKILEYGFKARDLRICKIENHDLGQRVFFEFKNKKYQFDLNIAGEFQAFNALCALGNILAKYNLNEAELEKLLLNFDQLHPALGRMQRVATLKNNAQIFIDFAHSPDALTNVLKFARKITKGRLMVLFGCGGNRDAAKRPIMGKLASDLADVVIVSDDNPRNEDAAAIRVQIMQACDAAKTIEIANRKLAIEQAISSLQANDILILAGKGHEKYQIIGDQKSEFDEEKIVKNAITKLF